MTSRQASARPAEIDRPSGRDLAWLSAGIAGVSTSAPFIAATAVPAMAIAFWRNALATVVLVPYAAVRHREDLQRWNRREWAVVVLGGALLGAHFATWVPAVKMTSIASATTLIAAQPVWAALIARAQGRTIPTGAWPGIALAVAGVVVLAGVDVAVSGRALVGDGLALGSGALAAAYVTAGGAARRTVGTTPYTAVCYATAAVGLLGCCVVAGSDLWGYDAGGWWRLLGLTICAQLIGHSSFNQVLGSVSPTVLSMAILFEVPGAVLLAAIFLGDYPRWEVVPGLVLLLVGVAVVVRSARPHEPAVVPVA